jgi:hypothetical protein
MQGLQDRFGARGDISVVILKVSIALSITSAAKSLMLYE